MGENFVKTENFMCKNSLLSHTLFHSFNPFNTRIFQKHTHYTNTYFSLMYFTHMRKQAQFTYRDTNTLFHPQTHFTHVVTLFMHTLSPLCCANLLLLVRFPVTSPNKQLCERAS